LVGWSLILATRTLLGWAGLFLGVFALVGGLLLALGVEIVPDWLVFAGSTIGVNLWIIILGVYLFRTAPAGTSQPSHQETR
jgi:hypothetical protein